ncbi:ABC transporter ATP-binding protein [Bifidobacterium sp. 82T10]|uniref:ABC transporter ATP-binding protein n=1 Tax=Bifidobacterium miconis TaxID=2834435 RepID=A0ABS6WDW0_9BIFI|nr:ABC transporter ATP-binding protein [Bifidobacterium miconis]MBW3092052.1 ABC transporter ATP-binding protein [Bifidobacterium miconis]
MSNTTPCLEFDHVSISYTRRLGDGKRSTFKAVKDVTFSLDKGGTLGIAGESGSGKSTLAMASLRLLPKNAKVEGTIRINGTDVNELSWGKLRALRWTEESIVFQGAMSSLNPVQKVREQIDEALRIHVKQKPQYASESARAKRINELLADVDLPVSKGDSYPHQLSGGQRQRVMIAMALACDPEIIIADEPTTALDVIVQAQILNLLKRLVAQHGLTLVVITHDLSVLADTCERIMVMKSGEIVETGESANVMTRPKHPYTKKLASAFPTIGDWSSRLKLPDYTAPDAPGDQGRTSRELAADGTPLAELTSEGDAKDAPIFQMQHVRVDFGSKSSVVHAVDDVTMDVYPHEIIALVGQSGSGKSTMARTLLGLQKPTGGDVKYEGAIFPRHKELKEFREHVQFVLQDPSGALNPKQTVYELVAEGPRIFRMDDEENIVYQALEEAGLSPASDYVDVLPQELSGGQRQRVVIAGALALHPKYLIADEPVASLDASARAGILALFLRFKHELGMGSFIITHDLGLAWNIADRVAVMYQGKIVEDGPAEQVLLHPQHPYTRKLLSVVPSHIAEEGIEEAEAAETATVPGAADAPAKVAAGTADHA